MVTDEVQVQKKQYLTELDVEAEYGFPVKTLRQQRFLGTSPFKFIKLNRKILYDRVDIEAALQSNKYQSTAESQLAKV